MHTLFAKRLPVRLLLLMIASALTACEASTSQDGPILSDGSVVIAPSSTSGGTIGLGTCNGIAAATIVDTVSYTITTFNAQGQPIGKIGRAHV